MVLANVLEQSRACHRLEGQRVLVHESRLEELLAHQTATVLVPLYALPLAIVRVPLTALASVPLCVLGPKHGEA